MKKDTDRIKEKLDIVEFIKSYVDLKPAGKNFKGICPFHHETDASFIVSPERQTWHCFGCQNGGDLITFVMLYENLEFPEALQFLAEKAGVEIETRSRRDQKEFEVLYDINKAAENFFHKSLAENKKALLYLKKRGLKSDAIKEFKLGYSPGGDKLVVELLNKGFKIQDLEKAGLAYKGKSNMYRDRFGGRIIFPIANRFDKTVGFSGRILEESGEDVPKYVNTPQTPVYNKSKVLYGLNKAKKHIVDSKTAFLVEGNMDVIMAYQSGVKNAVAVSGTSLTTQHLVNLQRLADSIIVSFDNDSGGLRALERSIEMFGKFDFHVLAVDLGKYKDPAEACHDNPEFLKEAVKKAKPAMTRLFEAAFSGDSDMVERKKKVRDMLQKIRNLKSSIDQDAWLKELSRHSGVSEVSLQTEFENIEETPGYEEAEEEENLFPGGRIDLISRRLLVLAFTNPDFLRIVKENRPIFPDEYRKVIDDPGGEEGGFLEMEATYKSGEMDENSIKQEFKELLRNLKIEDLKNRQVELRNKMIHMPDEEGEKENILKEFQEVAREIDELRRKNIYLNN